MSAAQQQQKAAASASASAAGAEQEEVEHRPFPIEQLQVWIQVPRPPLKPYTASCVRFLLPSPRNGRRFRGRGFLEAPAARVSNGGGLRRGF